jgi:TolA-binding protein
VQGNTEEAIRLSKQLEDQFPTTSEAIAAHVSLGLLYLQVGQPASALDEFRRYRKIGVGSMNPEALWAEGQSLRQLGREAEERATLEELLRAYPESAYSAAVRKRLAALH